KGDYFVPIIVAELRTQFRQKILSPVLGDKWRGYRWANSDSFVDKIIAEQPPAWLPAGFANYGELLKKCFQDARTSLAGTMGPDESKWRWGHPAAGYIRFKHLLADAPFVGQQFAVAPFPQNGSAANVITVNAGPFVSMRLIADLSDWDQTREGIALGE